MPLVPGDHFGAYEVEARLGAGGMGEVWRARDPRLEREVALKVLPASAVADEGARARLLREARIAARLNHPNVCTIHEVGEAEGQAFIAMELVEGRSLSERLAGVRLPTDEAVRLGVQMAEALAHAHERGVVHRDFKSGNVVITPEGRAKVLDFGLAKPLVGEELAEATTVGGDPLTGPGAVVGTLAYMAPEQLRGQPADARSDVWALGVVLHEMADGRRPFGGTTGFELSSAILNEAPRALPEGVPAGLAAVIGRCLAKEPGQRYQRAGEVRSALEAVRTGTAPAAVLVQRAPMSARWTWVALAAVGCAFALTVLFDVGGVRERVLGGRGAEPRVVRMAVLPFANLSGDPEQEYLADGFTQEMITQLGRLHPGGLSVIARTSVMRYKNGDTPVDQIGRDLRVEYVLEGSAQREGSRVRIAAELIHVDDQAQLWAESYEREMAGILTLQSELARRVANALTLKLLPAEQARLTTAARVRPEAYDAWLKGTYHWQRLTPEELNVAQGYFELALAKDPSYPQAHQGLAWVWAARQATGESPPGEAGPRQKAAALKAIELDEGSAGAHEALAVALTWTDWDWAGAEPEWRRALDLDPSSANTHAYYAHYLAAMGRLEEAVQHSQRALDLDPFNALYHGMYGMVLLYQRRFDEAIAAGRRAQALNPELGLAYTVQQRAFVAQGMREEQLADQRRRIGKDPGRVAAFEAGLAEGGYEGAQRRLADLLATRYLESDGVPNAGTLRVFMPVTIAWRYRDAGDYDRAMEWLEKAYEAHDPSLAYLGQPVWGPLRSSPRFQSLLRRVGLPSADMQGSGHRDE